MSAFDWSDYMRIADELATREGDQAAARTAVTRAYYAAFGTARRYLRERNVSLPTGGATHPAVSERFHATPDQIHRRIANSGRQLRRRRGNADYEDAVEVSWSDAREVLATARRLLADLAKFSAAAPAAPTEPAS